jgi:hypothetical protein
MMSVDFYIQCRGESTITHLNMSNFNAAELLEWIGLIHEGLWEGNPIPARKVAPLCRRRLWDTPRNWDPELPAKKEGRMHFCGRPAGYLREKTWQLLLICEHAIAKSPDATIYWG